jgi:hypothetical protein
MVAVTQTRPGYPERVLGVTAIGRIDTDRMAVSSPFVGGISIRAAPVR